ncbi:MAG TPA: D-alanyl-D-alanine carboxypeptidase/D-alanyl-D-alanine-endopeptidase [Acidiferrobacterales bacterium]|nr:D-alanyl-D-alanine carboxypeptidase/D-alanyl-D-alanine-endopeptidase [Acidiferrobacterales bacterium]
MSRILVLILGLLTVVPVQAGPSEVLPAEVARTLKQHGLSSRGVSVYVHEIGQPEAILAVNADEPRNPASTMKLLTTLVALEELGPAYAWKTEAYASAPVRDGVLDGDLYIKGYGDPYLVIEHFWRFLRALRKGGLTEIRGDLVIDQGFFEPVPGQPADFDRRPHRAYNVQPRALLVNFQTVNFRFQPQPGLKRVQVIADPQPAQFAIDNRVRLTSGPCRGGAHAVGMQVADRAGLVNEASFTLVLSGGYSASCGADDFYRVVAGPEAYIHGVFRTLWTEMGGRFAGGVREAPVPDGAALLHSATSPPLSEIIRVVNKYSNNVMTRQLLLTLGAEKYGAPGTTEKGVAAIHAWLAQRDLKFPELVLENGSGLSRNERISARHLGAVLLAAWHSPAMPEFLASLPILSVDGTLKRRNGGGLAGRAHLKGGSIDNVRAQAGLLLDERGRRLVVVVLHNDTRVTSAGEQVQNAVLAWANSRP